MELREQVCSLELAKKLKELGVKQDSYFIWFPIYDHEVNPVTETWVVLGNKQEMHGTEVCSAFTVAELGEILPLEFESGRWLNDYGENKGKIVYCCDNEFREDVRYQEADTEADARAKMLIYLLENKLITI